MNRRETLLTGMAAAASFAIGARTSAAEHDHGSHAQTVNGGALLAAAVECVRAGELCLAHCHQLLATGDKSMAACAQSVSTMLPVCQTLASLAAQNSPFLARYAALAADICLACEAECRKHEQQHATCRDCAASCAACAKACNSAA